MCGTRFVCYASLSCLSYPSHLEMTNVASLRVPPPAPPHPPTLTDSDEQQRECGYRQWSDKLIDFPTVSMKKPRRDSVPEAEAHNNEGNANDSLFYLAVRNCESRKRAQARVPPSAFVLPHYHTAQSAAASESSDRHSRNCRRYFQGGKKESVVGWLSRCTGRASLWPNCSMSSDNLIGNRQQH